MKRVLFFLAVFAVGCGGEAPPPNVVAPPPVASTPPAQTALAQTPDAPFRQKAPGADGNVTFTPPTIAEFKLKNGLRVLLVERHDLPVVAMRLVVNLGAGDVPEARPGTASFLGGMLEQGTKKRTALQVSDDYESVGAQHGAWLDWDSGGVSVKVTSDKLDAALEIMSDVALAPTFPDGEIDRVRARRVAAIQSERTTPGAAVQNTIASALFGRAHPYGHSLQGQEDDAKKLTRAELVRLYERIFVPRNAAIVVAGDITRDALTTKLEASFGGWKDRPNAATRRAPKALAKADATKRIVLVDMPGAQSQVQLVRPGVAFATPDRDRLVVMNAIFGGMFTSRVNMNLREKHGYTYGARSHFVMRHGAGPFLVGASVFADKTIPSIKEMFLELEGLAKQGPTDDELALAKESIRLAMPGRFETTADVVGALDDLVVHDLPLDEYAKRPARIDAVTAADVKRVAAEWLKADNMTVVVVGDKSKLAPELDTLGLGTFEERDAYGDKPTPAKAAPAKAPVTPPAKP